MRLYWNTATLICVGFPGGSDGKESGKSLDGKSLVAQMVKNLPHVGDLGSIPASGRSSGGGNGYLLQYSCLGNPMDRGVWQTSLPIRASLEKDWVEGSFFPIWQRRLIEKFSGDQAWCSRTW